MVENQIPAATKFIVTSCIAALQIFGRDVWPLFFALFGASIGSSFAPAMSRRRYIWHFISVSIVCSLFGVWFGQEFYGGNAITSSACAALLAMFFHPMLGLLVQRMPRLFDMAEEVIRKRLGLSDKGDSS